jgi:hypothetical protein
MRIPEKIRLPVTENIQDMYKSLVDYTYLVSSLLNGGIKFADNFNAQTVTVSNTGTANADFAVAHTLKRIPTGYILISNDKAGFIYNGTGTWTTTNIYLKHSVANAAVTVIVF